jgi:hypothetical protein
LKQLSIDIDEVDVPLMSRKYAPDQSPADIAGTPLYQGFLHEHSVLHYPLFVANTGYRTNLLAGN